jgi:transposase-like protein
MGINRNTVNLWYGRFREAIVRVSIEESTSFTELNGIHAHKFHLHLKECEFRYNHKSYDEAKPLIFKNLLV